MKKYIKIKLVILSILLMSNSFYSQDIEFSQFYATKNYLNPAFTGLTEGNSFTTCYRNQWPSIKKAYESHYVNYELKLNKYNAGLGIYFLNDVAGEGSLKRQTLAFQYSKFFRFTKKLYGSFGLRGSYNINSIEWDKLTWGDMIDVRRGFIYNTNQPMGSSFENYFDTGAGFLLYTDKLNGGVAVEHINRPNIGLLNVSNDSKLPIRYKLHLGGKIRLQESPNATEVYIAPQLIYTQQGKNKQIAVGSYLIISKFALGVWHRVNDSFIFLIGMEQNDFRIGYSYDLGTNSLINFSGGAHEISLTYNFKQKSYNGKKKYRVIYCPKF